MRSNKIEDSSAPVPQDAEDLSSLLPVATRAIIVFLLTAILAVFGMLSFDQGSSHSTQHFLEAVSNIVMVISVTLVVAVFVSIMLILRISNDPERSTPPKSAVHPDHSTNTDAAEPGMRRRLSKAMASLSAKFLVVCLAGSGICLVLLGVPETIFSLNDSSEIWSNVYTTAVFLSSGVVIGLVGLPIFLWDSWRSTSAPLPKESKLTK